MIKKINPFTGTFDYITEGTEVIFKSNHLVIAENFNFASIPVEYANSVWEIRSVHNLGSASVTIPAGVILYFNGGQINTSGNLVGNLTKIVNPLNKQIFSTAVNFTGTWTNVLATPQWFGAQSNINPNTFTLDSTAAIQKLFNTPFEPHFPNGFYYITSNITISRPVTVMLGPPIMEHVDSLPDSTYLTNFYRRNDHVRFYTNLNIRMFTLASHRIYWKGGVIDTRNVAAHTEAAFFASGNSQIWGGEIDCGIIGNRTAIVQEGIGTKGFFWDGDNVSQDWGYLTMFKLKLTTLYVGYPVLINKPNVINPAYHTWVTSVFVELWADGFKQAINIEQASSGSVWAQLQTRWILTEAERYTPAARIGGSMTVDVMVWDMSQYPNGGLYRHNSPLELVGENVRLVGNSIQHFKWGQVTGQKPGATQFLTHKSKALFLDNKHSNPSASFISVLHNCLAGFHKRNPVSIAAYDGSQINFDTEFTGGGEDFSPNITISNPNALLDPTAASVPIINFGAGADLQRDFVEIYIVGNITLTNLYLNLIESFASPRRIQVIGNKSAGQPTVLNLYPKDGNISYREDYYDFPLSGTFINIIVRLIGSTASGAGKDIYIADFAGRRSGAWLNVPLNMHTPFQYSGIMNQAGTVAPTLVEQLNTTGKAVTTTYNSVGNFYVYCNYRLILDKTDPVSKTERIYNGNTWVGSVRITRNGTDRFIVETFDTSGNPANGILTNYIFSFKIYW